MIKTITELVLEYVKLYNELLEDDEEKEIGDEKWIHLYKKEELSELKNKIYSEIKGCTAISIYYSDELPDPNKINGAYIKVVSYFESLIYWVRELQSSVNENGETIKHHILCIEAV